MTVTVSQDSGRVSSARWRTWLASPWSWFAGTLASIALLYGTSHSSFWFSDDYLNFARARELGLKPEWINGDLFGHWLPARKALDWLIGSQWPLSWEIGLAVLVAFVAGAAVFTGLSVRLLTGSSGWGGLAAIALPLSGAVVGTVQWYAAAAQVVPALMMAAMATWLCLRIALSTVPRATALAAFLPPVLFVGLLFDERTAVLAVVAPLFIPLLPGRRRRTRRILLTYVFIVPTIVVWYLLQVVMTPDTPPTTPTPPATFVEFMMIGLVQNAAPSLLGWTSVSVVAEPLIWFVGACVVVIASGVVIVAADRFAPVAAVTIYIAATAGVLAPVALVRAGDFGAGGAIEPRYVAMASASGVIALVLVARAAAASVRERTWRRVIVGSLVVAILGGTAINLVMVLGAPVGGEARRWAEEFERTADETGASAFYNSPVSELVVPAGFYPYNLTATVLPQLRAGTTTVVTSASAGLVRRDGTVVIVTPTDLGQAVLQDRQGVSDAPSGCVVAEPGGGRLLFASPAPAPEGSGVLVITVHGRFGGESHASLLTGPEPDVLRNKTTAIGGAPPMAGSNLWVTTDEFDDVRYIAIDVPAGESLCWDSVDVGYLPRTAP